MTRFSVRRVGYGYGVFDGDALRTVYPGKGRALDRAERLERIARQRPRSCLTCGKHFMSDGPGHRMCTACRHQETIYDGAV